MVLVRYLLLFGGQELYEEERDGMPYSVTVGEYIIHELAEDELEMLNPRLREIQNEYRKNYRNPDLSLLSILSVTRMCRFVNLSRIF